MSKKSLFTLLFITALAEVAFPQAKSPFSAYGIGDPNSSALVNSQGMGGVGISNPQYYYLNNQNPALLVYNMFTNIQAGFSGEQRTIRNSRTSEKNSNGNLGYITMAFPIIGRKGNTQYTNRWSSSFALMPYSTVNYKLNYSGTLEGTSQTVTVTEKGSGGINQVVWSNGVTINRYLSVGIKSRYLFGSRIDESSNFLSQAPDSQPNIYERQRYSDINFTAGVSFHMDSITSKNFKLNVGLVYDFKANVKTTYYSRLERVSLNTIVDSVTVINDRVGNTTLPPVLGGGISVGRKGWIVGADIIYTDYTQFRDYFGSNKGTISTMHYGLGGEFSPFSGPRVSYFSKMTYRAGVTYDDFPYLINGSPAKDVGINIGFALPVVGSSSLDIALKVGKRGDLGTNGIAENYFRIYFGATFNDRWFAKRKFD